MDRQVTKQVRGFRTQDGAGVSLVRVLGHETVAAFDPILMLDSFDSVNPDDYTAGFPMHPHRGIETVSYIYRGQMSHKDSLGNEDTIADGEVQWMTAGSGIMHEEKLPASERMLGVQLWLNLPADSKMVSPAYHSIKHADIQEIQQDGVKIRLLAGVFGGKQGYQSNHLPLDYYDIHLDAGASITVPTDADRAVMIFTLLGDVTIGGERVREKTAASLGAGEQVVIEATGKAAQVLFISSKRLDEPIFWGGPIVMDTQAGLQQAFDALRNGTFLEKEISY